MITWILLVFMVTSNGGISMVSVPGFVDIKECREAGTAIVGLRPSNWARPSGFTCVKQTQPVKPLTPEKG